MLELRQALEVLHAQRTDELVIVPFTGSVVWEEVSTRPELDLPYWGSMGKAASTGLGVVLAVPQLRVWVIDGDGSLLMNLGCLVTTAQQAPRNFVHFVLENGVYATTGGQPIPGAHTVDFPLMARAAGFARVFQFDDPLTYQQQIGSALKEAGPVFISLKVAPTRRLGLPRRRTKQALPEVMATVKALATQQPMAT